MKNWNFKSTVTGHAPTDKWLENQPLWHDSDMLKAILFGTVFGLIVGVLFGYGLGLPDFSNMPITYVRG
jgi:hypothetical protein